MACRAYWPTKQTYFHSEQGFSDALCALKEVIDGEERERELKRKEHVLTVLTLMMMMMRTGTSG